MKHLNIFADSTEGIVRITQVRLEAANNNDFVLINASCEVAPAVYHVWYGVPGEVRQSCSERETFHRAKP